MRAATHGCNEGSIEAGWLGQSHLPVMLNYVPTTGMEVINKKHPGCTNSQGVGLAGQLRG